VPVSARDDETIWRFLGSGGEMARRVREHDWAATPLGPAMRWPQPLKTLVSVMLGSNQPMFIAWGPQRTLLYNDSYREVLANKHPALGQDLLEVWHEIRADIEPLVAKAYGGEPSHMDDIALVLQRRGYPELTHWAYSYTPIPDESGAVAGFFCPCHEVTGQVLAAETQAFRVALEDRLRPITNPTDVTCAVVEMLGRHLGANRVGYGEVQPDDRTVVLHSCYAEGVEPLSGSYSLDSFGRDAIARQRTGATEWCNDVALDPAQDQAVWQAMDTRAYASVPLVRNGRLTASLYVNFREPHAWTRHEIALIEEVAARTWSAVERGRAEALTRRERRTFYDLVQNAPFGIYVVDSDLRVIEASQVAAAAFGGRSPVGTELTTSLYAHWPPAAVEAALARFRHTLASGEPYVSRHTIEQRVDNGAIETYHWWLERIVLPDGRYGVVCYYYDLTDHTALEAVVREREEQLRLATDAAEIGFWDVDLEHDRLFWPPRVKAMFGISPDVSVTMQDFYNGLHPEDRDATAAAFAAAVDPAVRATYDVEYRTVGKEDGAVRWVAAKGRGMFTDDGRCVRVLGTAIDITARKEEAARLAASEAALVETAATLDASIAYAPIGFAFFDRDHRYVRVNETLAASNGLPVADHIGRNVAEIVPVNAPVVIPVLETVFRTGEAIPEAEVTGETPARPGEVRSWLTSVFPVFGSDGETRFAGVTVVDITARKRAEERLAALNATLEARVEQAIADRDRTWNNARDMLAVIDTDGLLRAVNPAWTSVLGWHADELTGRRFLEFIHPDDREPSAGALTRAVAAPMLGFENRLRHCDGSYRSISWLSATEGNLVYASGRDVTDEKAREAELTAAQDALRQAQKMDAVGQLTGGIAHDFNNLLQGVAGSLDLIRRSPANPDRVRRWAEAGLQAAERGAKLTGQLLAFSRAQRLEAKPLSVTELIAGMRELLERTLGPEIAVALRLDPGPARVLADATQLEMAVLNLAINARDAMPGGGTLTIAMRPFIVERDPEREPGSYIELSVADSGSGMPPEVVARAFDPFFTTKDVGKGTGLGLSQVYGIARAAGGTARIESRPGEGTTVRLLLRQTAEALPQAPEESATAPAAKANAASVLVVDDDADVRRFLHDSLEALGYKVRLAADGRAGLDALAAARPDVVLLDYAMPGMNGAEMFRAAQERQPGVPIIFASGYANTAAVEGVAGAKTPILKKPFRIDELQAAIGEALDAAA
jgi:PAS domain S-box-containing protein